MAHPIHNHVVDLSIGFSTNFLILSVDRIFVRESIKLVGDPPRAVKEQDSVDLLCWDVEVRVLYSNTVSSLFVACSIIVYVELTYFNEKFFAEGYTCDVQADDRQECGCPRPDYLTETNLHVFAISCHLSWIWCAP